MAQALAVADALVDVVIDAVFCSPLGRAAATADVLARRLGLRAVVIDELVEVHHGRMAGLTNAEIDQGFPGELDRREEEKYGWRFPDGESYADADARAAKALRRVGRLGARRPLVVSHEMIGRMLLKQLLELDVPTALAQDHPNDLVYVIESAPGTWSSIRTARTG